MLKPGNTKGGSITVPLTSCLTGLDESVLQIKTKIVSCHTADSKPVKQEVNGTVILPPLVFPVKTFRLKMFYNPFSSCRKKRKQRPNLESLRRKMRQLRTKIFSNWPQDVVAGCDDWPGPNFIKLFTSTMNECS